MRVIAVTPAVPHPFGDTAAKWSYVLIRDLLKRGHSVVSVTGGGDPTERVRQAAQLLGEEGNGRLKFIYCALQPHGSFVNRKLASLRRPHSELLRDRFFIASLRSALSSGYDVVHLEQLFTGWLGFDLQRCLLNIHHFEIIDWEGQRQRSLAERKDLWQMKRATTRILQQSRNMRMFTPRLEEKARTINPTANYWVLPFALDMSLYPLQRMVEEPVVGLIGSMHWRPSRSAADRLLKGIWPIVKRKIPSAKLLIAGWNAGKYLAEWLPMTDVEIAENLSHPIEFFSRVAVMAYAPSRGSGMKIKVMESMAYGIPVVTTWEGVEGISYENGLHCCVGADDEGIADHICRLIENRDMRKRVREAARTLLEDQYSATRVVDKMTGIYSQVAEEK